MGIERTLDSARKISLLIESLKSGKLKVRKQDEDLVRELLALPRGPTGLVDIASLTPEAVSRARAMALVVMVSHQEQHEHTASNSLGLHDAQCKLFRLFEELFVALTGTKSNVVSSIEEIKSRILDRVRHSNHHFVNDLNNTANELAQFYAENATSMFQIANSLGGVKVVMGGQRTYGESALTATRIAGLYCDTQLIPDPVYPFFTGALNLNALHLKLAINLFHILPLRPLADARMLEPPVFIFPSFEEILEEKDAITQSGIASLLVKVVAPACDADLKTIEEVFEYAKKHEHSFLDAVTRERLFVPPGGDPANLGTAQESARIYLRELEGVRSEEVLSAMKQLPPGVLVLNGVVERLRPHYHLLENAEELAAQPMLSQRVHWYYFERCAHAEALDLLNDHVLSRESLDILRALQDDSLTWLANIPIEGLVDLRRNLEHAQLREQLQSCTAQLASADFHEIEAVTREVRHGLQVLIQRQQMAIKDIEAKYSSKTWAEIVGASLTTVVGASMFFMPAFAGASGVTAPEATVMAGIGAGGVTVAKVMTEKFIKKRRARRTLLGLLATAYDP